MMDRRSFIKKGALGSAVLLLGGGGFLALRQSRLVAPHRPLQALSPTSYSVLVAIAARVLQSTGADPREVACRVDDSMCNAPPAGRRDFNRLLGLFESAVLGLFLRSSPAVFTQMSAVQQDAALLTWRDSRLTLLAGAYHALRRLCLGAHYSDLEIAQQTGYPGPFFEKAPVPAIQQRGPLSAPYRRGMYARAPNPEDQGAASPPATDDKGSSHITRSPLPDDDLDKIQRKTDAGNSIEGQGGVRIPSQQKGGSRSAPSTGAP